MDIPSLVTDLAVMMLTAGIVSVVFRQLKLPLILGYIVVGFLISPYFPLFFDVEDTESIEILSEIGVIIILFHIGLEFNLHKLLNLGSTAIVTAFVKMSGVMVVGYGFGMFLGLSRMNCLFLGAMLSISSTVVIKKCFEEAGVQNKKYASLVMGTLIMEDVFSVFMMVVLSTLSVSAAIDGAELALNLSMMGVYLIIWLILGIYFLPTLLNRIVPLMPDEVLIAFSLGVCFGMALLAKALGFSVELGAFMAGSLFAGTVHVEKVEHCTSGIKDMFSILFFLSVGMMVDPQVIADRWTSIIPIAVLAIIAKLVFDTLGMILSGQSLGTAVRSGFALAPIGEFSFIIASLGISLGVMDSYLYPVIVSASILTTLITPVLIKKSDSVIGFLAGHLPSWLLDKMIRYSSNEEMDDQRGSEWAAYIKNYLKGLLIYGVILLMISIAGVRFLSPALDGILPAFPAKVLSCLVMYLLMAVFVRPLMSLHDTSFSHLWLERTANRPPLVVMVLLKVVLIALVAYYPLNRLFHVHELLLLLVVVVAIIVFARTDVIATYYLQLETHFLRNLNERTIAQENRKGVTQEWLDEDINIMSFYAEKGSPYLRKTLASLNWGKNNDVYVVKVRRGDRSILLPSGSETLHPEDKVYVVGERAKLEVFRKMLKIPEDRRIRTLREFMENDYPDPASALSVLAIKMRGHEPYCGQPIVNTKILERGECMVIGIQKDGLPLIMPDARMLINKGDILWLMGSNNNLGRMAAISTGRNAEE